MPTTFPESTSVCKVESIRAFADSFTIAEPSPTCLFESGDWQAYDAE